MISIIGYWFQQSLPVSAMDGFLMYCTSNQDGTGSCVNQEDGKEFACLIVPGQIISCPGTNARAVECVWISGVTADQAQFWCDLDDEAAMYGRASSSKGDSLNQETLNPNETERAPIQDPMIKGNLYENVF